MSVTKDSIMTQLRTVNDPELHRDLVSLNMIKNVAFCDGYAKIHVELTTPGCPLKDQIRQDVMNAIHALGDEIKQVEVEFSARPKQETSHQQKAVANNPLPDVQHVIAIGAGKGGVGKSTVSCNVAVGLARRGFKVGLLDGDIYGPSMPTLLGLGDQQVYGTEKSLFPFMVHGIKAMTLGKLVEADKPLIWRGPMAHGTFQQLALQTDWGELDYLIVDLPPGTGDVPLTLAQMLPLTGAIVVCTPQKVAQDDAVRAVKMFGTLDVDVLGVVENMSYFIGDDGKEYDIFGKGGAQEMAKTLDLPVLGNIPIHMELRANSDNGDPRRNFEVNEQLTDELNGLIDEVIKQVGLKNRMQPNNQPTFTIS